MADANIKAVITAEDRASKTLSGFGDNVSNVGKKAVIGIAAVGVALTALGVSAVKAFSESEAVMAQTNAVLKSTGGVAGVTAKEVSKLASSLQSVTKFSDEQIQSGENLLLTFTKIGKDIFPQATEVMLDMSQALGQDVKSSAIQLGKALQDPILGVTALRRVGVNFNKDQQEVIKNLVETGRAGEAQAMILKELQTEFGGSAKAAGKTFAGQLVILKNTFGDLMEIIGRGIVKVIQPVIDKFNEWLSSMGGVEGVVEKATEKWKQFLAAMKPFALFLRNTFLPPLEHLWDTIKNKLLPAVQEFWDKNQNWLLPAMKRIAEIFGVAVIGGLLLFIKTLDLVIQIISSVLNFITSFGQKVGDVFNAIVNKFIWVKDNLYLATWEIIKFFFSMAAKLLEITGQLIGRILLFFLTLPIKIPSLMKQSLELTWRVITSIDWGKAFKSILDHWVRTMVGIVMATKNTWHAIFNIDWGKLGKHIMTAMVNAINSGLESAINSALSILPGKPKINLPKFAGGTDYAPGGMALVGERGPEMVSLPRGSKVTPTNSLPGGGSTINITVQAGAFMGSQSDARKYAMVIADALKDIAGSNNTTVGAMLS